MRQFFRKLFARVAPYEVEAEPEAPRASIYDSLIDNLEKELARCDYNLESRRESVAYARDRLKEAQDERQHVREQLAVLRAHRLEELAEPPVHNYEQRDRVPYCDGLSTAPGAVNIDWDGETRKAFDHLRAVGALRVD